MPTDWFLGHSGFHSPALFLGLCHSIRRFAHYRPVVRADDGHQPRTHGWLDLWPGFDDLYLILDARYERVREAGAPVDMAKALDAAQAEIEQRRQAEAARRALGVIGERSPRGRSGPARSRLRML